jgi:DNA-binding XRE family transcriptional regulator
LPFLKLRLSAPKPLPYPQDPSTLGEHLKKRRHELSLLQRQAAAQIGIGSFTYITWEKDQAVPGDRYWPAIVSFLGYNPDPQPSRLGEELIAKRRTLGLPRKTAARLIGVDEGTLWRWETEEWQPSRGSRKIIDRFLGPSSR